MLYVYRKVMLVIYIEYGLKIFEIIFLTVVYSGFRLNEQIQNKQK